MKPMICALASAAAAVASGAVTGNVVAVCQRQGYPLAELNTGYLGRYVDQPLCVDPDIDPANPYETRVSQADNRLQQEEARRYGIDGFATFPAGWRRTGFIVSARKEPVDGVFATPILDWWTHRPNENDDRLFSMAMNDPAGFRVDGKRAFLSFNTDGHHTPEELRRILDGYEARHGGGNVVFAEILDMSLGRYRSAFQNDGDLTPAMVKEFKDHVRGYLRVVDGIMTGGTHMQRYRDPETQQRILDTAFLRRMTGLIREVMAEKEFDGKKKYLGMQVVPGYECCYDHGSNVGCDGTRTLRSTLDVAKEMRPDVLKFSEWDEFNENTCVCPTLCNGYTTRRIVRGFLDMYRTGRASMQEGDDPSVPNLVISYRKTLSPGEPLAVEVLNIADGTGKGRTRVSVNVYDEAGKLIHAFPPKEIDASKTADVRYVLNTGGITSRALQVELEYLTGDFRKGTVGEGLHPVDFALGNSWNEKWVKHAVRDLPAMKKAKVALSSDREMSAELECGEPIRYAMVQGGDEILYIHNPDDIISRFREDDDWAVFHIACISMLTVPPGEREFSLKVEGVPEAGCEWIRERRHYKGTEYVPHWLAMSTEPVYLRIPKSRLKDAVLKVDLGGKKCGTVIKGRIPLRKAHSLGAYSLGAKGGTQVAVGRLNRQASYPSVWNRTSCSFDVKLPADRRSMMYIAQVVTMSGKVWRSRPFCWGGSPEERMLTYDFSPAAGDLIRPRNGEQWFFGRLGDFFSASTMRNRGPATSSAMAHQVSRADLLDDMRPARVRDEDGTWALVFDGKNDVACFPWETVPRFSPWEVAMEFRPDDVDRRQLIFACRRHGGSSGLRGIELDKGRLVVGYCDFLGEGNRGWTSVQVKSGVVKAGEWNSLRLRHTGDALQLEVNGVKASQKSSLPSMCMSTAFLGGLDGVRYAGRVRNLRIRQFRRLLPPAEACTHVTEIPFLEGERWFGGAVNLGNEQPYDASSSPVNRRYGGDDYDISKQCWGGATVPFLLSDKGRYVWSDRPFRFSFDSGVLTVKSRAGKLEPVVAGKTLKDAYFHACRRHFPFTGTPPPEEFFTKPQFNNWIEMYIRGVNQKVCEDYADEIVTNRFPCGVHMVDGGWMLYHGALKFEPTAYPEPRRLFDKLRGYGWKSMLWFAYFVSPDSRVEYRRLRYHRHKGRGGYAQGLDYLLHVKDPRSRQAAVLRWWSGISCAYDLTNPEVFRYFVDILKKFAEEYRFDGFKFDAGNPEYVAGDCRFHESWMEPCDYATAWNDVGLHIPYNEFRSGFKTGGKPVVQRLHDQPHKWEAQGGIIKDMLVAGLLGYPYAVPDMIAGGLCGSFPPGCVIDGKLFVRSCQAQSLMPMMQFSLAPWRVLDKRKCDICRDYAELHVKFGPYIMDLARHAARTGEPIMRSMDWEFPGQGFGDCFTQFMLGGDWLIAPVITPDDAVTVRLPAGRWRDDLGEEHEGPKTLALKDVPLERLPRFRRLK